MTREECVNKVREIMINKNPYGAYHKKNFVDYYYYGENAPVNSSIISDLLSASIILEEDVYESLMAVVMATNETNQEFPFFLYGHEVEPNVIKFDTFVSSSKDRQSTSASFNQYMNNDLTTKVYQNLDSNYVACHGHSHPAIGELYNNFSLGDMASYVELNENNSVFKNKRAELISCLLTPNGDINFLFYDNVNQNFFRIPNVYVKEKGNNYRQVNSYGMNQEGQMVM